MPEINYYNVKENAVFIYFPLPSCIICTRAIFWVTLGNCIRRKQGVVLEVRFSHSL